MRCYHGRSWFLLASFFIFCPFVFAKPSINWPGPYVGVNMGGAFASSGFVTNTSNISATSYFNSVSNSNSVNVNGTASTNSNRLIAGIQAGENWQYQKNAILGATFDYDVFQLHAKHRINSTYPDGSGNYSLSTSMNTNWLFMLRGRAGYVSKNYRSSLFYLTAGMALTNLKVSNQFSDNTTYTGIGSNHADENQIGWVAGGGVEIPIFDNLTLNLEYSYVQFPNVTVKSTITNSAGGFGIPQATQTSDFATSAKLKTNMLRMGLHYHF